MEVLDGSELNKTRSITAWRLEFEFSLKFDSHSTKPNHTHTHTKRDPENKIPEIPTVISPTYFSFFLEKSILNQDTRCFTFIQKRVDNERNRAEGRIQDPRGQRWIMGRGDVPGLARKSRPKHLPGRQKHAVSVWREREGRAYSLMPSLKRTDHVCVRKSESVCTPVLLHIKAWNNGEQQFIAKLADPPIILFTGAS